MRLRMCTLCLSLLLLTLGPTRSKAARFKCTSDWPTRILMDESLPQADHLVPEVDAWPGSALLHVNRSQLCTWKICHKNEADWWRMILEGVDARIAGASGSITRDLRLSYQLPKSLNSAAANASGGGSCSAVENNGPTEVTLGHFRIFTLPPGDCLTVKLIRHRSNGSRAIGVSGPVAIKMLLPDGSYCARDMASYGGNYYAVTSAGGTLEDALASGAAMATFDSIDDVRRFVLMANNQRDGKFPEKVPLNLTRAVRLGMFYSNATKKIYILDDAASLHGQCALRELENSEEFIATSGSNIRGSCGTLTVNKATGQPAVEFLDCNASLPALLKFTVRLRQNRSGCVQKKCAPILHNWLLMSSTAPRVQPLAWLHSLEMIVVYNLISFTLLAALIHCKRIVAFCRSSRSGRTTYTST